MKYKVIILRALPWGRDARVERWAKIYSVYEPLFGVWGKSYPERSVKSVTTIFRRPENKFLICIGYIWFSLKSFFFVLKNAKKNDMVVFIDLETILFAWLAALLKGAKIHYDMADPFYLAKPIPWKSLWRNIEKIFVKNSFRVSAPHVLRLQLFYNNIKSNMFVIENVPIFESKHENTQEMSYDISKVGCITLGYFGGLEKKYRGLEKITELVINEDRLRLIVAGSGELTSFFIEKSQICDRIEFLGSYKPEELPYITKNINVYLAYYSSDKFLHTIAAPNKYYEHLFLGKPILTSCIIPQSKDVIDYNTGWCIDNDDEALIAWKDLILNSSIDWKGYEKRCRAVWEKKYANYYMQHQLS